MIETRIYSTLVPIYPDKEPVGKQRNFFTTCKNQPVSFQMAYRICDDSAKDNSFYIKVTSALPVSQYYINNVAVLHTSSVDTKQPVGMYPDILLPKKTNPEICCSPYFGNNLFTEKDEQVRLHAFDDSWQALYITINEDGKNMPEGEHEITLELIDRLGVCIGVAKISIKVLSHRLAPQKLLYTNWFHNDCLADIYDVEIFSDKYFEIFENYVKVAAKNGMNMILLPAFTPPLDTPVGGERKTAQLVGIKKIGAKYEFDFSLMKKFIDICKKCGITHFEHSHLFTQWGAKATPKIMAEVSGKQKKIFGWETDATSKKYVSFLTQYIGKLSEFLKQEKLEKKIIFHVSDEPQSDQIPSYAAAHKVVEKLLENYAVGDALSHFEIYEKGLCKMPIVATPDIAPFLGKVKNLWAYYVGTSSQLGAISNRTFHITRERNRMIGVQLFYHNIKGFLHWGYNNYYGELSQYIFNPGINPCGGFAMAGTSYSVYPAFGGKCHESIRQKMFAQGITDIRLLSLAEKVMGKEKCRSIIEKHFGKVDFSTAPQDAQSFDDFIDEIFENLN